MSALVRSYKMENVSFVDFDLIGGTVTYAIIDRGNEEFISMTKAEYDRRQAEQSTQMVTDDPKP